MGNRLGIRDKRLAKFCREKHILSLWLFVSPQHKKARKRQDLKILVEFEPGRTPGQLALTAMSLELSGLIGRKAYLRTRDELPPTFTQEILSTSQVQYSH